VAARAKGLYSTARVIKQRFTFVCVCNIINKRKEEMSLSIWKCCMTNEDFAATA